MNPDSGKLHVVDEKTKTLLGRLERKAGEAKRDYESRATAHHANLNDNEPPPGHPLPPDWKLLAEGVELKPMKGLKYIIHSINADDQTITIKVQKR